MEQEKGLPAVRKRVGRWRSSVRMEKKYIIILLLLYGERGLNIMHS